MIILIISVLLLSCNKEQRRDLYALHASTDSLVFLIDENTRIPKHCLWTFKDQEKEYLVFPNRGRELLFYDMNSQEVLKKVTFDKEGENGIDYVGTFGIIDFNNIYIAHTSEAIIYVTDTTARVHSKINYEKTEDSKTYMMPTYAYTKVHSPICFFGDSIYISQEPNGSLGEDFVNESPVGVMIDRVTGKITETPLKYTLAIDNTKNYPYATGGDAVSTCYDGESFIYSDEIKDSIYTLSLDFKELKKYSAKSRYIKKTKVEVLPEATIDYRLKRKCELPVYGNLIYDKYRNVYYRFAFPKQDLDGERDFMEIYQEGRKQFSIIILDKDFNILGETLFPEYTYNSYIYIIREDGLYLNNNHSKRPDFDENILRFQKIELIKL